MRTAREWAMFCGKAIVISLGLVACGLAGGAGVDRKVCYLDAGVFVRRKVGRPIFET
jgi:hypothetical protein